MLELQRLRSDHADAVLAFETMQRAYFAASITDRGDEFFEDYAEVHRLHLAEMDSGRSAFHVLVDENGKVVGRFNLYEIANGAADVGYRMAENVAGRGIATSALKALCRLAAEQYGLRTLKATTSNENIASQRVLVKADFVYVGPAVVAGRPGRLYERVVDPSPVHDAGDGPIVIVETASTPTEGRGDP
jgi:ribosomal-protein-alanine N-acetyltransferase